MRHKRRPEAKDRGPIPDRRIDEAELLTRKEVTLPYLVLAIAETLDIRLKRPASEEIINTQWTKRKPHPIWGPFELTEFGADTTVFSLARKPRRLEEWGDAVSLDDLYRGKEELGTPLWPQGGSGSFLRWSITNVKTSKDGGTTIQLAPWGKRKVHRAEGTSGLPSARLYSYRIPWGRIWGVLDEAQRNGILKPFVPSLSITLKYIFPQDVSKLPKELQKIYAGPYEALYAHMTLQAFRPENKPGGNAVKAHGDRNIQDALQYHILLIHHKKNFSELSLAEIVKIYEAWRRSPQNLAIPLPDWTRLHSIIF